MAPWYKKKSSEFLRKEICSQKKAEFEVPDAKMLALEISSKL